jgi:HEAT repeat protein
MPKYRNNENQANHSGPIMAELRRYAHTWIPKRLDFIPVSTVSPGIAAQQSRVKFGIFPSGRIFGFFRRPRSVRHIPGMQPTRRPILSLLAASLTLAATGSGWLLGQPAAVAATPDSPEVRALVTSGLQYLEKNSDPRLGGKCLIALAFLKDGSPPEHPRIQEALQACRSITAEQILKDSVYSNGLAIIFLAEFDRSAHRELINRFAGAMTNRQKPSGAWGYQSFTTGDTSQTQYAALCFWELLRIGLPPNVDVVDRCTNWLLRTQDPDGGWGYQGTDPGEMKRVEQRRVDVSMVAAGLGSTMIFGHMLGLLKPGQEIINENTTADQSLPPALRPASHSRQAPGSRTLSGSQIDSERLRETVTLGQQWMSKHFSSEHPGYNCYYLYSLERYKSFEELINGDAPEEPEWYQLGLERLQKTQKPDGGWDSKSNSPCATAFAILFLIRSTQQSIRASLGEGTLTGGRGLHADLSRMKLRGGKLVVQSRATRIDSLLEILEDSKNEALDELLTDGSAILVDGANADQARRLQQLVRSGSPEARLLAVKALGKIRQLEYVPALLHALTDPDHRVVRAARDSLRMISRRFNGFGLPDNFTDLQQYDALEQWKGWYRTMAPNG